MSLSDESAANATNGKHPPTPFNIDGEPIIYDGNPAHVEGILHELSEWTARTGHYVIDGATDCAAAADAPS